jgi:hypothetical protein
MPRPQPGSCSPRTPPRPRRDAVAPHYYYYYYYYYYYWDAVGHRELHNDAIGALIAHTPVRSRWSFAVRFLAGTRVRTPGPPDPRLSDRW